MIELPTLYDHQTEIVGNVRNELARLGSVVLCAEPGAGKTRMSKFILGSAISRPKTEKKSGFVLFAVYGRNLVDNASNSYLENPPLPHGLVISGKDTDWSKRVQVGSIDTLLSWYCGEGGSYESDTTFDMITFDECHAHLSKFHKLRKAHDAKREALGLARCFYLGLSATPEAEGMADVFRVIVKGPTTEWLIGENFLSPFRYVQAKQGQLGKLVRNGTSFTKESVCAAMDGLSGDLVRDWRQFADGRPTVGFFPRRSHAMQARDELVENGIMAEYVDGETPDWERQRHFDALNKGYIEYICNVGVVERGTNIPAISCVQLCTCIGSVVRYRQMIGRGSRYVEDKADCLVIDHGGNIKRHGFFEDDIEWVLDNSKSTTKEHLPKPTIECPNCHRIYRGGKCMNCEYEPTATERKSQGLSFDGSELKEIERKPKADKSVESSERILISALYAASHRKGTWKQALAIAYGKAKSQGTQFKVPNSFEVGGKVYYSVQYGSQDASRRLTQVYPFLSRDK